jgi:hypothetical protein
MSLGDVKRKTSSSEFVLWMEYLEWEINAFDKNTLYLAQIAAEVRRSYVRSPKLVKIQDFIMKFTKGKESEAPTEDVQTRAEKAKSFFFGLTGLMGNARKRKRR